MARVKFLITVPCKAGVALRELELTFMKVVNEVCGDRAKYLGKRVYFESIGHVRFFQGANPYGDPDEDMLSATIFYDLQKMVADGIGPAKVGPIPRGEDKYWLDAPAISQALLRAEKSITSVEPC